MTSPAEQCKCPKCGAARLKPPHYDFECGTMIVGANVYRSIPCREREALQQSAEIAKLKAEVESFNTAIASSILAGKPYDGEPGSDDLVNRLRGIYTVPVNDGAGLLNGKDTFTRRFAAGPIQLRAAAEIERLRTLLSQAVEFWYDDMPNPSHEAISLHDVVNTALKPNAGG